MVKAFADPVKNTTIFQKGNLLELKKKVVLHCTKTAKRRKSIDAYLRNMT